MPSTPRFHLSFAQDARDRAAAQALRYQVFVNELGGAGDMVDHASGREADAYDAHADHLLLRDLARAGTDQVIGVYRLMTQAQADAAGGFSSAAEYDLSPLLTAGRPLLELGRSCVHPDYRGGPAMQHLWQGLADHIRDSQTEILFGVASFHGTDAGAITAPLAHLRQNFPAPAALCPVARGPGAVAMSQVPLDSAARKSAVAAIPPLIKAYLRLGGGVGEGAYIDRAFNTIDVCMVVDVRKIPDRMRAQYDRHAS